jgi:RNA polymerase sigma factor (sigma-70 family)
VTLTQGLAGPSRPVAATTTPAAAATCVQLERKRHPGQADGVVGDSALHVQLVIRSRRGDAAAFAALVDAYERVALAVAYSILSDAGGAGDVVQDAFLKAWQRVGDLKEPEKFGGWLCGIVRNLAIDAARARAVRSAVHGHRNDNGFAAGGPHDAGPEFAVAQDGGPLDELDRRDRRDRVAEALQRLDEVSRSTLVLRYYENLSSKQIGELLGLAPTAVDMRLMRARRQLRGLLVDLEEGSGEPTCMRGSQTAGEV